MPTNILATRLNVPPVRAQVVERSRLIDQLNDGLDRKWTLVSAPAGFGKTTLAAAWAADLERPVAWLSLEESESDPYLFLTYLVNAVQGAIPGFGDPILAELHSPQPPPHDALLVPLLNELETAEQDVVVILDDYHVIDDPEVDELLTRIVRYLPAHVHLVLASREDPPLALARHRARHQVAEIRADDLRFTPEESAGFLNRVMGLGLNAEDIAALEARTEGWIAGLQLAALSMQHAADRAGFIESFTGSNRFVLDYLLDEVLERQPERIRRFLLRTSVLSRFCGPLCDFVLEDEADSQATLEFLQQANLFLIPLDDERGWFRYHHLFSDLLRLQLRKEHPEAVPQLHVRASRWFEKKQMPHDSIRHALSAKDYERAAALIEMEWPALFNGYRPAAWYRWVEALPEALVRTRPQLNLGAAWVLLHRGDLEAAEAHLAAAARWAEGEPDPALVISNPAALPYLVPGLVIIPLYMAAARGDLPAVHETARRAQEEIEPDDHYHQGIVRLFLGLACWGSGDLAAAAGLVAESLESIDRAGNAFFQAYGTTILADIDRRRGRLNEAAVRYGAALRYSLGSSGYGFMELAERRISLSELCRERNEFEAAAGHLEQARQDLSDQAMLPGRDFRWHMAMAKLQQSRGDLEAALRSVEQAERVYRRDPVPVVDSPGAVRASIRIDQGRLAEAAGWAGHQGLSIEDDVPYLRETDYLAFARLRLAQGRRGDAAAVGEALRVLDRILEKAEAGGRIGRVIEVLILQALAHGSTGDLDRALGRLEHAMALAEPEEYIRVFADEGEAMARLLSAAADRGIHTGYAAELQRVICGDSGDSPAQDLIDPLSDREIEVLGLIAGGRTNQQIAEDLFIALSTVKGHNQRIYEKLQVRRRTEAVARGRELGYL